VLALFGVIELPGAVQFIMTIPEIIWELSIGFYLTVKGASALKAASRDSHDAGEGVGLELAAA
jgi:hypothetical protein